VLNVDAVGVVFFDAGGTMISANDTFLRWSGYTREDLAARALSWQALTPPEWHEASLEQLERLAATGRIGPYEKEYLCKDGSRRWMLFAVASLDDGTIVEYVLDIGRRKQAEQAQRESEERYRTLFESIDAGFCVLEMIYDAQGKPVDYRFLEVNRAFERQTGLKDATRKTMREHVPAHEQHWFETYHRVAETGEPARFVNAAKPLMGGWYEVYAYRVGGPGSRKVAVLFNDITERVRAVEALQEADRRKDEFLAMLGHELRNPLAPIRNALTFMRLKGLPDPALQNARDLIDRQVAHLVRLVDDLLDVSRIAFGKVELRRELVDLRAVAEEAVATSRPLLDEAGQRLTVRIAPEPLWIDGDRVRLLQVISNLLNNAARYTPAGGEVLLELGKAGGEALLGVKDNGVGIPKEMLTRIFDAFIQLRQPPAGEPGGALRGTSGLGIGLSLSRMLVELHGGRIGAESEGPGRGSRFVVRLPLVEAASLAPPAQTQATAGEQRRRFLVVDDNADAAVSQAELLRMLGHEAETAYSGAEALRKAARFRPEVVLLDLGMPGMDGFEVARELRRMPELEKATIIAQTGWGQEEDRRRTAAAGFDAHLAKPVELRALMEALARTGQA
jgi:PAS domain S-box-containing protein